MTLESEPLDDFPAQPGDSPSSRRWQDLPASLATLDVHDHACLVCDSADEARAVIAPFVRLGLERHEKCLYFADGHDAAEMITLLRDDGVAVDDALAQGQLVVTDAARALLQDGELQAGPAIGSLDVAVRQARDAGYRALRVVSDLPSVLTTEHAAQRLLEYEADLTRYLSGNNALRLCVYDRGRVPAEIVRNAMTTHPLILWAGQICRNHFYVPADDYPRRGEVELVVDRQLASVLARRRGELEVQQTRGEVARANADLRAARAELERRIDQRTEELVAVDRELRAEVAGRREVQAALAHESGLLRAVLDASPALVMVLDGEGRFVRFNRTCESLSGHSADEAFGKRLWDLVVSPDEVADVQEAFSGLVAGTAQMPFHHEHRWLRRGGGEILISWTAEVLRDASGEVERVVAVGVDVTEWRALEEELRELALRDDLTDLLNRRGFTTLAEQLLRVSARMGRGVGLLFVDCDNMKRINDRYGHSAGDEALRETAQVLLEAVREADVVGRLGGDEFAVLLVDAERATLERVLTRIAESVRRHNNEVKAGVRPRSAAYKLGLSAGGALFDPQALDPAALEATAPVTLQQLIDKADRVMYAQKGRH
jgi:diguanylate cyclase (GGDEF)-like protein/PAS domain S-box-containing protein